MHRRHSFKSSKARALERDAFTPDVAKAAQGDARNNNLMLLISDDDMLGKSLRDAAEERGLLFARSAAASVLWQLRALRPGAVVLDLDLTSKTGWETADRLLKLESCPPLFLLAGQGDRFAADQAVHAGPIVDKFAGPARLLRLANQFSPPSTAVGQNPIQRIVVQWLGPCGWPVRVTSANGFYGIRK
jgi:ActR/RegA family two-component response regulator